MASVPHVSETDESGAQSALDIDRSASAASMEAVNTPGMPAVSGVVSSAMRWRNVHARATAASASIAHHTVEDGISNGADALFNVATAAATSDLVGMSDSVSAAAPPPRNLVRRELAGFGDIMHAGEGKVENIRRSRASQARVSSSVVAAPPSPTVSMLASPSWSTASTRRASTISNESSPSSPTKESKTATRRRSSAAMGAWQRAGHLASMLTSAFRLTNRPMLRQTLLSKEEIMAVRIHHSDTKGIGVVLADGTLLLLNKFSGKRMHHVQLGHCEKSVRAASFDTTGERLLIANGANRLTLFDVETRDNVVVLTHTKVEASPESDSKPTVRTMQWSPDDSTIATGGQDATVRLFDAKTLEQLWCQGTAHTDSVVSLCFDSTGRLLATGGKDKRVALFRVHKQGRLEVQFRRKMHGRVYGLSFASHSSLLAVGDDGNKVTLLDSREKHPDVQIDQHADYVRAVAFMAGDTRVVSFDKSGQLIFSDTSSGQPVLKLACEGFAKGIAFDARRIQFVTWAQPPAGAEDHTQADARHVLTIFNIFEHRSSSNTSFRTAVPFESGTTAVTCVSFSPCGNYIMAGSKAGDVVVCDVLSFERVASHRMHTSTTCVCISPCGQQYVSTGRDGGIVSIAADDMTAEPIKLTHMQGPAMAAAFSPCSQWLAVAGRDIRIFDADNTQVAVIDDIDRKLFTCITFHPAVFDDEGELNVTRIGLLAAGNEDRHVTVYNPHDAVYFADEDISATDMRVMHLKCHEKEIFSLAFSPAGDVLATASRDKTACIIDMDSQHILRRTAVHGDHVTGVCFTPQGQLATASLDRHVRVFEWDGWHDSTFDCRVSRVDSPLQCIAPAPANTRFAELTIAGCRDGSIYYLDLSMAGQQPLFEEATAVIRRDEETDGSYAITRKMVQRYPLTIHAADQAGDTLCHHAVRREQDGLLAILLDAATPQFWLPLNRKGQDILHLATMLKSRACVKIILDKIIEAKEEGRLAPLPVADDRFLRNLMRIATAMDDLAADFLKQLALDDAGDAVGGGATHTILGMGTLTRGSNERSPPGFWNDISDQDHVGMRTRPMVPRVVNLANVAGLLSHGHADPVSWIRNSFLHTLVRTRNAQLFGNAVMKYVIEFKWKTYARRLFIRTLLVFASYLVLFTTFSVFAAKHKLPSNTTLLFECQHSFTTFATLVLACIIPLFSLNQLYHAYSQIRDALAFRDASQSQAQSTMKSRDPSFSREASGTNGTAPASKLGAESGQASKLDTQGRDGPDASEGELTPTNDSSPRRRMSVGARTQQRVSISSVIDPSVSALETGTNVLLEYFKDGWHVLQLASAILTMASCGCFVAQLSAFHVVTGIAAFSLWLQTLHYLRAFEFSGGLVRMVFKVFYYTGPFLLLLMIVLLGAANCFYVLFSEISPSTELLFSNKDNIYDTLYKMFQMLLLGDGGVPDELPLTSDTPVWRIIVKLLFIGLMLGVNVFMLNLMINLMDDFMQKINDEEGDAFPFEKAQIIAEVELMHADWLMTDFERNFPVWLHVLCPKDSRDAAADEWQGTVSAIRFENAMSERRTRAYLFAVTQQILERIQALESRTQARLNEVAERADANNASLKRHVAALESRLGASRRKSSFDTAASSCTTPRPDAEK